MTVEGAASLEFDPAWCIVGFAGEMDSSTLNPAQVRFEAGPLASETRCSPRAQDGPWQ
jgi:hypothetical protein